LSSLSPTLISSQYRKDCVNFGLKKWSVNLSSPLIVQSFFIHKIIQNLFYCWLKQQFNFAAGTLSAYKYGIENPSELCCLVVDCGYSFTHLIPFVQGKKITEFVRRIEIGGKVLTNHLKDIISYRLVFPQLFKIEFSI